MVGKVEPELMGPGPGCNDHLWKEHLPLTGGRNSPLRWAPVQINLLIGSFATTLPSTAHTEAFLRISASAVAQLALESAVVQTKWWR